MAISNSLADQKWYEFLIHADEETWLRVRQAMRVLAYHEGDWIIDALHNPHWSRRGNIADAVAYAELVRLLEEKRVFLSLATANAWAAPNRDLEANQAALEIRGIKAFVQNAPQDFDGSIEVTEPLKMRCLYATEDEMKDGVPVAYEARGHFPLEIGACTMSKCVANLTRSGRLARLPFEQGLLSGRKPRLYLLEMQGQTEAALVSETLN